MLVSSGSRIRERVVSALIGPFNNKIYNINCDINDYHLPAHVDVFTLLIITERGARAPPRSVFY